MLKALKRGLEVPEPGHGAVGSLTMEQSLKMTLLNKVL